MQDATIGEIGCGVYRNSLHYLCNYSKIKSLLRQHQQQKRQWLTRSGYCSNARLFLPKP